MFLEIAQGVPTAIALYEQRKTIANLVKRWGHLLLHGNAQVGVFGAGGVGKTTLGAWIKGDLDTDRAVGEYAETIGIEKFNVAGETPAYLTVVPGQTHRREATWNVLYREILAGKSLRVLNVASWGMHATELERPRHRVYQNGQSDEHFRDAYFTDGRNKELDAVEALVPHLSAAPGHLHMVTLVTKQDLWWSNRNEVRDFYENGRYNDAVQQIEAVKGSANFQHTLLSCALVEQNLLTPDGFTLAQTVAGYDDALRVQNLARVAGAIDGLVRPV